MRKLRLLLGGAPEEWVKEESNPIFTASDVTWTTSSPNNPAVLRDPVDGSPVLYDGYYWMAYNTHERQGGNAAIGLAKSTDLISWVDASGNPILDETDVEAEDWESGWVNGTDDYTLYSTDFLYMGNESGVSYNFWLFYVGHHTTTHVGAIGIAKSNDMVTWVRDLVHNPIASWIPDFVSNCIGIEDWRLQKMSNGNWVAVYEADVSSAESGDRAVGIATTTSSLPDSGWSDEGQVFSTISDGGNYIANPTIIRYDENGTTYYEMLYEWLDLTVAYKAYGASTTEDSLFGLDDWDKYIGNPIISPTEEWESIDIVPNCLIAFDGKLYCYYTGNSGLSTAIGLAVGDHLV